MKVKSEEEEVIRHEERLFQLFSYDRGFQIWKTLKKMEAVESHYRFSLQACRKEQSARAYLAFLPIVYKWLEDAYLEYGLEIGSKKLRWEGLQVNDFLDPINHWRKKDFGLQVLLVGPVGTDWIGVFRFYEYFVQIDQRNENEFAVSHGAMPSSLSCFLYHYLTHSNRGCWIKFFPHKMHDQN